MAIDTTTKGNTMNTKRNDINFRKLIKSMKIRVELAETATSETEREMHLIKVQEISDMIKILNDRI